MIKIAYKTISYGSSGEDVKKLQKYLNENGYSLSVDGQFGSKTQNAVRDYQKKNGLSADGIVGDKTWAKLYSSKSKSESKPKNNGTSSTGSDTTFTETPRPEYQKSAGVQVAEKKVENWENSAPKPYESKYSDEIESILSDILNREPFSYNMNADPLYQQYRDLYIANGRKAMEDTVGAASALTGGYGNSYAVTAGSQSYHEYLDQLTDVAIKLRDRAYEQYGDEGDKLIADVTLLRSLDGDDYDKYLGELERYYKDGEYLLRRLSDMSDAEFQIFLQQTDAWESDRDFAFKQYTDAEDRKEFDEEMAFKKSEAERDQANEDRDYALALSKRSSSSSSGGDDEKVDVNETIRYPESYKEFVLNTGYSGIMTKEEFNRHAQARGKYKNYKSYLKAMYKKYKNKE